MTSCNNEKFICRNAMSIFVFIYFLDQVKTMEDDFGASSTSPFLTESLELAMEVENESSRPSCFSCAFGSQNGGRRFFAESYLASGSLKRYESSLNYKYKSLPKCSFHSCLVPLNADRFPNQFVLQLF